MTDNKISTIYITTNSTSLDNQTMGVEFALGIIDDIINTNNRTNNPQASERTALLTYIHNKIANEYTLATGLTTSPTVDIIDLKTKLNKL